MASSSVVRLISVQADVNSVPCSEACRDTARCEVGLVVALWRPFCPLANKFHEDPAEIIIIWRSKKHNLSLFSETFLRRRVLVKKKTRPPRKKLYQHAVMHQLHHWQWVYTESHSLGNHAWASQVSDVQSGRQARLCAQQLVRHDKRLSLKTERW